MQPAASWFAPYLDALHRCDVPCILEVEPVCLVELGPDEKEEVIDELVLAHQRRRQTELAAAVRDRNALAEHLRGSNVHLCTRRRTSGKRATRKSRVRAGQRGDAGAWPLQARHCRRLTVENDESPLLLGDELHGPLGLGTALTLEGDLCSRRACEASRTKASELLHITRAHARH